MNAHTMVLSSLAMQANPAPAPKSLLMSMVEAMSWSGLFVLVCGLVLFIGACLVVAKSPRTSTIGFYLVLLPLPTYIGILGQLKGIYASLSVIALTGIQPSGPEWAGGFANTALMMFVCLLVTFPSYLVVAYGLFVRASRPSVV